MPGSSKPLRADAARNRARVLKVAAETFAEQGADVPLDEIARRAGVGPGTVYRHFPNKEALFKAIVSERLRHVMDSAHAQARKNPADGLYLLLEHMTEQGAGDVGLSQALAASGLDLQSFPEAAVMFAQVMEEILVSSQRAGTVRSDVSVSAIKMLIVGLQAMAHLRGAEEVMQHIFPIIRAGLTPPSGARE